MKKRFVMVVLPFIFILCLAGCNKGTENIKEVNIYEMKNFSSAQKDSLITITDSKVVRDILKGFSRAKKEAGIVNMDDPQYKVELENETYFLWLSEEHGTIMNSHDTNTIFTLSKSSAKTINELLN